MVTTSIDNGQDIIDSRDVIARIEALQDELAECAHDPEAMASDDAVIVCDLWAEHEELIALKALAEEGEASPDWQYGEALIRDSYFTEYAHELAEDIDAVNKSASWPLNHIDWEAAAEALQADYVNCDFDGVTYWIRA